MILIVRLLVFILIEGDSSDNASAIDIDQFSSDEDDFVVEMSMKAHYWNEIVLLWFSSKGICQAMPCNHTMLCLKLVCIMGWVGLHIDRHISIAPYFYAYALVKRRE